MTEKGLVDEETSLIHEELIFTELDALTSEELLTTVGNRLIALGYVKESFIPAIIKREKNFPTGLKFDDFHVAIPHTDTEHINKAFVAVVKSKQAIPFIHMGTDSQVVEPRHFFILGIKEKGKQVDLLSTMMENFSDKEFVNKVTSTTDIKDLYAYLTKKL